MNAFSCNWTDVIISNTELDQGLPTQQNSDSVCQWRVLHYSSCAQWGPPGVCSGSGIVSDICCGCILHGEELHLSDLYLWNFLLPAGVGNHLKELEVSWWTRMYLYLSTASTYSISIAQQIERGCAWTNMFIVLKKPTILVSCLIFWISCKIPQIYI